MPTAENAQLQIEAGQDFVSVVQLSDSGDHTEYTSAAALWAGDDSVAPSVRPNGIVTGGVITPAVSGSNDKVDMSAISCNLNGVVTSIGAQTDKTATRPGAAKVNKSSLTVTSGSVVSFVTGSDGDTFSAVRGAAGGPPYIPVGSIEVGQVWFTTTSGAAIDDTEIKQVVNSHKETASYPIADIHYETGSVVFSAALPLIHTGDVSKKVYAEYYTPSFAPVPQAFNVEPPATSYAVSSSSTYDGVLNSVARSLGQGKFSALLQNGIDDLLVALKGKRVWFKFFPNKFKSSYLLFQGFLGITRTFPADKNIESACTVSAEKETIEKLS